MPIRGTEEENGNAERILMAALKLFSSKGYAGTTVREIVQEANVTNPMVYYYFGNKEGLFHGLLDIMLANFHGQIREVADQSKTIEQLVEGCVQTILGGFRESPQAFRFVYAVLFGPPGSFPEHDMFTEHDQLETFLNGRIEKLCPEVAPGSDRIRFLFGLIDAFTLDALRRVYEIDESQREAFLSDIFGDDVIRDITNFFLRGIGIK